MSLREKYEGDGFCIAPGALLPREVVERAVAGMDAVRAGRYETGLPPEPSPWKPGDDETKLCKIEMPQFANHAIRELISHPAIGQLAAELTGAKLVQAWWVQLLYKPPARNDAPEQSNIGWHQDRQYWGAWEDSSELFTAWVALSDVTAAAGPMKFLRGSNHWDFSAGGDFYSTDLEGQRASLRTSAGEEAEEVAAVLPPGGVSFHHGLTYHGSGPNYSGAPRRSFAIHLRTQNAHPASNPPAGLTKFINDTTLCPIIYHV